MTDLERAREILAGYPLETAQHVIAEALAAARREGAEAEHERMMEAYVLAQNQQWAAGREAGAEEMRERAAITARNACLVPPDGGSPTEDERLVCEEAERRIHALPLTPEKPT